mgnify:CR=1 FL=1
MKTINNNTKKAQAFINAYNRSSMYDLQDAYRTPSTRKTRADYNCRMMMQSEGGHNYKIIGYNSSFFTVAWIAGNALRIETAYNSFIIPNVAE